MRRPRRIAGSSPALIASRISYWENEVMAAASATLTLSGLGCCAVMCATVSRTLRAVYYLGAFFG